MGRGHWNGAHAHACRVVERIADGSGQRDDAFENAWTTWQQDLARRSTNSSLIIATGIGHEIQTDQPQLVINTILRVVEAARLQPAP